MKNGYIPEATKMPECKPPKGGSGVSLRETDERSELAKELLKIVLKAALDYEQVMVGQPALPDTAPRDVIPGNVKMAFKYADEFIKQRGIK